MNKRVYRFRLINWRAAFSQPPSSGKKFVIRLVIFVDNLFDLKLSPEERKVELFVLNISSDMNWLGALPF